VDANYDIGRIEDVHWNPWFSDDASFVSWQILNGQGFVFGRSDWEYVFNTFAFAYAVGYRFIETSTGACNGNFLGIGADMAVNASVQVDQTQPMGLQITNGEFTCFLDPNWGNSTADHAQVVVSSTNVGSIRFVNSAFWGPSYAIAKVDGPSLLGFSDCTFEQWDFLKQNRFAIESMGTGSLVVQGNEFSMDGNQVSVASKTVKSVISGNIVKGKLRIQTASNGPNTQVFGNAADE